MLQENLLKIYETSFRENREMSALTDYFKNETFSYYEMAKEIAKLHLLFKKAGIKQEDLLKHKDEMIRDALADTCTKTNPRVVGAADIEAILKKVGPL